jgi:hypothetical protein
MLVPRRASRALGDNHEHGAQHEHPGRHTRRSKRLLHLICVERPRDDDGNCPEDDEAHHPRDGIRARAFETLGGRGESRVVSPEPARRERPRQRRRHVRELGPEIDDDGKKRPDVARDVEAQLQLPGIPAEERASED